MHPELEERGVGAGMQPKASRCKWVVSQSCGCEDLDSSTRPEPARRTQSLSLEKLVKPLGNRSPHPRFSRTQFPFCTSAFTRGPLSRLRSLCSQGLGTQSSLHLPKSLRRSPPQISDLGWEKPSPSLTLISLSHRFVPEKGAVHSYNIYGQLILH